MDCHVRTEKKYEERMDTSPTKEWDSENPLDCLVCKREMEEPVRLTCHHSFCRKCVTSDCPLCKAPIDCPQAELKPDSILSFLIDSSHETADVCANCDKVSQPMHFCETCQQPLCNLCKLNTHQAKMFISHRIVLLEERGRVRGKMICAKHNEPFILYSLDSRMLVCIECFNSVALDSRHNLVNIDSAHKMNCEKLEKSALKLRSVQDDLREHIEVRRRFMREIGTNSQKLVEEIQSTCQELIDKLVSVQTQLIAKVEKEQKTREKMLTSDLNSLLIAQVPIKLYLLCCSIFCSSASKIDFLHWYGELSRRLQALSSMEFDKIQCSADFSTFNCRAEFSRSLESILGWSSLLLNSNLVSAKDLEESPKSSSGTVSPRTSSSGYAKRRTDLPSTNSALSKYQLIVDLAGAFGELFQRVDVPLKQLVSEMSEVSKAVQEAQKDLTLRRQLVDAQTVNELIMKKGAKVSNPS
uniref:RING finger protein 207 n=1 Tax=Steinernema glaseri TaxID=37863 RepID=A0A1I7ZRW1_9BILA